MRRIVCGLAVIVLVVTLGTALPAWAGTALREVGVAQARELLLARSGKPGLGVLDVRTPAEFAEGRLAGAVNLDVQAADFEKRLAALDRGKAYLVYCRSGNRSRRAVEAMKRLGFADIHHMVEGVLGWQAKGYPLVKD